MNHDLILQGEQFSLRPVNIDDAPFIVELRTDPELSKYIHATSASVEEQREWLTQYLNRPDEWYFIIEDTDGTAQGTICIYNVDRGDQRAEWGRWVLIHRSLAAVESAALIYDVGFNKLGLKTLYCHTESANKPVVSFHKSMGLEEIGPVVGPQGENWTEQEMKATAWPECRRSVEPLIKRMGER